MVLNFVLGILNDSWSGEMMNPRSYGFSCRQARAIAAALRAMAKWAA
jgi:hypothetical protein